MLKVLLVNTKFNGGGAGTVFYQTVKVLKENFDKEVVLYTMSTDDLPTEFKGYVEVHEKLEDSMSNPVSYIFNYRNYIKFKNFLLNNDIDIIHLHNFYGRISPSILLAIKKYKKIRKVKVIQTLHDYSLICPNSSLFVYQNNEICEVCISKEFKYKILLKRCYHGNFIVSFLKFIRTLIALKLFKYKDIIDIFISPSEFLISRVIKDGIPKNKIILLRNPFGYEVIDEIIEKREPIILYVGRLSPEKGVDLLIRAFIHLKSELKITPEWKLYIVGSGEEERKLKHLAKNNKNDIIFTGWLNHRDIRELMLKSKILILPSRWYENAPNVILEALLSGLKVITTNHGGMKEFSDIFPEVVFTFDYSRDENLTIKILADKIAFVSQNKLVYDSINYTVILKEWDNLNYGLNLIRLYKKLVNYED